MAADTMGLYPDDPSHFSRWMASNHPGLDGARYPPRRIYGQYLASLFESAKQDATSQGIHLEVKEGELIHLCRSGDRFVLTDDSGRKLVVDRVVLALGNFTTYTQPHLTGHPGYVDRPWPLNDLNSIPAASSVCIVGSRLSGIDAALHLAENSHNGSIYLASRSGCLPSVQGLTNREYRHKYLLELLARDLEDLPDPAPLQLLAQRLMILAEEAGVNSWGQFFQRMDPLLKLSRDILDAEKGANHWRLLADSVAPILERYWNRLSTKDQMLFMENWHSTWYTYVHAMPYENALKLQDLLKSNRVKVLQFDEIHRKELGFSIESRDERIHVEFVVEATGLESTVSRIKSPFLRNLLESRVLEEHPVAGLSLCQYTLELYGVDQGVINDTQFRSNLKIVFLTAHENVQQLLNSVFWELGNNQPVQTRLREEVLSKNVISPTAEMLNNMPYLTAVVYEMLRLYPPVSQLINRVTIAPAVLAKKIEIPGRTWIGWNAYGVQTDSGVWGSDAMVFAPERWGDNIKDIKAKCRREQVKGNYIPFNAHARKCLGSRFAILETQIALFELVRRTKWTVDRGPWTLTIGSNSPR
ncbi:hypothetical protein IL306_012373 [Fusarium sp. DS 682]|nr:hypothetical protein IL306_012373 [Fusarium sp. DS 682]